MTSVGFTGTRHGMTVAQYERVKSILASLPDATCHHGDCIGADAQFHDIASAMDYSIIIHPPVDVTHRAFCRNAQQYRMPLGHFARNRAIVVETEVLIATPMTSEATLGGTWYTIGYARRLKKPLTIVEPTGAIRSEHGGYLC